MAGELEDAELGALAATGCSTTSPSSASSTRRGAGTRELERSPPSCNSRSTGTRRWPGAACWAALAGRFDEAERLAARLRRLAERRRAPDARTHFTAQLVALRREQGRLDELLPEIERLAGDEPTAAAWRSSCRSPISTPATARARGRLRAALADGATMPRTMLWLTATALAGRGRRASSATPTAPRGCTPSSSRYADRLSSGASPATPAPCTACSAAPPPSPAGASDARRALRGGTGAPRRAGRRGAARANALRLRRAAAARHAADRGERRRLLRRRGRRPPLGMAGVAARAAGWRGERPMLVLTRKPSSRS